MPGLRFGPLLVNCEGLSFHTYRVWWDPCSGLFGYLLCPVISVGNMKCSSDAPSNGRGQGIWGAYTPNALSTSVRFLGENGDIDQNMFWISKINTTVTTLASWNDPRVCFCVLSMCQLIYYKFYEIIEPKMNHNETQWAPISPKWAPMSPNEYVFTKIGSES